VTRGTVLLKLDDAAQQADLRRAEAALTAAQKQLAKAELLPQQHKDLLAQLGAAVEAAKQEQAAAEGILAVKRRGAKLTTIPAEELAVSEALARKAAAAVRAVQAKLKAAEDERPELDVALAKADVAEKEALVGRARVAVEECQVKAPEDGTVLRVLASVGDTLGPNPKGPALQFCPKAPRIVRGEIRQEWASRVKVGQEAVIEDDAAAGLHWPGRIKRISDWYSHRRSIIQEPFQFNDVRTLECLVEVVGPGPEPLRIGQRMRVLIK
jgi:multidrug resistance efflux pump